MDSGAVANANVALEVGRVGEVVEISAQAVQVNTTRQVVDSVITEREIKDTPLFSRNFMDLAGLAPGVFIRDGGSIDPTKTFAYRTVHLYAGARARPAIDADGPREPAASRKESEKNLPKNLPKSLARR